VIVVTPYLVKPVEEADIHLPTDGFQNPTEIQRLLGNQAHDGQSNGKRPMPTAIDGSAAPAPRVGAAPAASEATTTAQASQPRREEKVANAAPGFSFK
jgi:pilus assembly protein CpaC